MNDVAVGSNENFHTVQLSFTSLPVFALVVFFGQVFHLTFLVFSFLLNFISADLVIDDVNCVDCDIAPLIILSPE